MDCGFIFNISSICTFHIRYVERLLLPFGLHHMLTIPVNYTALGGEYVIQTGANMGSTVYGQTRYGLLG